MSVEVDVHLLKGDILVNHEAAFTRSGRNLKKLYLKPLYEMAGANNFESIYPNGPQEFILYKTRLSRFNRHVDLSAKTLRENANGMEKRSEENRCR